MSLGDWGPISPDSALPGYTGPSTDALVDQDDPSKYVTLSYWADRIAQFQATLINLDQAAQVATNLAADPNLDATTKSELTAWLADYNNKRFEFQAAAKTVNTIVGTANAFGVGLPQVSLPQTLAQWQPLAVAGVAAAVVAVAALVEWGTTYLAKMHAIVAAINTLPADKVQAALDAIDKGGTSDTLGQVASIVKWVAIGALIWFGYQAFTEYRGAHA
jgi:hypothetical protein